MNNFSWQFKISEIKKVKHKRRKENFHYLSVYVCMCVCASACARLKKLLHKTLSFCKPREKPLLRIFYNSLCNLWKSGQLWLKSFTSISFPFCYPSLLYISFVPTLSLHTNPFLTLLTMFCLITFSLNDLIARQLFSSNWEIVQGKESKRERE